jgi:hypothetical protein
VSYIEWLNIYHKEDCTLRPGQSFCNHFKLTDPVLFYMEDRVEAWNRIIQYAKDWQLI